MSYAMAQEIRERQAVAFEREQAARVRKVAHIVATVPSSFRQEQHDALADTLASWSQADRDAFAKNAGQRSPSEKTWALVVETVRSRAVLEDVFTDPRGLVLLQVLAGGLTAGGGR